MDVKKQVNVNLEFKGQISIQPSGKFVFIQSNQTVDSAATMALNLLTEIKRSTNIDYLDEAIEKLSNDLYLD